MPNEGLHIPKSPKRNITSERTEMPEMRYPSNAGNLAATIYHLHFLFSKNMTFTQQTDADGTQKR